MSKPLRKAPYHIISPNDEYKGEEEIEEDLSLDFIKWEEKSLFCGVSFSIVFCYGGGDVG